MPQSWQLPNPLRYRDPGSASGIHPSKNRSPCQVGAMPNQASRLALRNQDAVHRRIPTHPPANGSIVASKRINPASAR